MIDLAVYGGLFLAAFTAATLLPAQSEILVVGLLLTDHPLWLVLAVASVGNVLGRILIGLVSDYLVYVTQRASYRTLLLIPIVLLAIASQSLAAWPGVITTVHRLLFVSAMTGLMYGFLFGLGPVLVFEWFGVSSFSENWGWMSFAPVIFGNVYNIMFGRYVTLACARMRGREIRAPSSSGN